MSPHHVEAILATAEFEISEQADAQSHLVEALMYVLTYNSQVQYTEIDFLSI